MSGDDIALLVLWILVTIAILIPICFGFDKCMEWYEEE